jgi:hypothetical protein
MPWKSELNKNSSKKSSTIKKESPMDDETVSSIGSGGKNEILHNCLDIFKTYKEYNLRGLEAIFVNS